MSWWPTPGAVGMGLTDPTDEQVDRDIVDTNLLGVWHTVAATAPSMIRKGTGGSMVLISSMQTPGGPRR